MATGSPTMASGPCECMTAVIQNYYYYSNARPCFNVHLFTQQILCHVMLAVTLVVEVLLSTFFLSASSSSVQIVVVSQSTQ